MTNNNWIETNLYKILHELELCLDADVDNTQIVCSREEIAKIFYDSLTKKDQEHKAELKEIRDEIEKLETAELGDPENLMRYVSLQDAIHIVEKKLNTTQY